MSASDQNKDRLEATVVPVRRPDAAVGADLPSGRRYRGPLLAIVALVLVGGLVVVFAYLPREVDRQQADGAQAVESEAVPVEPAEVPLTPGEYQELRGHAEELLGQLLEQRSELEDRSAPSWGGQDWETYGNESRLADDALIGDDVRAAVEHYRLALATGERLFRRSTEIMTDALAAGEEAIVVGNANVAVTQFDIVLSVDPDNRQALAGRERAAKLPDVLAAMRRGDAARLDGDLEAAADAYREALALDRDWEPARRALGEATGRLAESRFEGLIAAGYLAISDNRFDDAIASFNQAIAMRPDSADANDGLAQAEEARLLNSIVVAEVRGMAFERREMWAEAVARYREALEVDGSLAFALEGVDRAQARADLESKLRTLIESPRLLLGEDVLRDANAVLAEARAIAEPGPRHTEQTEQLATLIELATTPISVTLVSDNATEVTVYRVGELGAFATLELELRPGEYTAIGARRGYRDVRESFTVLPGRDNGPVTVVCVEPI